MTTGPVTVAVQHHTTRCVHIFGLVHTMLLVRSATMCPIDLHAMKVRILERTNMLRLSKTAFSQLNSEINNNY
jgi:hypothetical protein